MNNQVTKGLWRVSDSTVGGNMRAIESESTRATIGAMYSEGDAVLASAAPTLALALNELLFNCEHGNGCEAWSQTKNRARQALRDAGVRILGTNE